MKPAFRLYAGGLQTDPGACLGKETAVLAEKVIPEFLAALGKRIQEANTIFSEWYPSHTEEFQKLAEEYAQKAE